MKTKNEILREIAEQKIERARVAEVIAMVAVVVEVVFLGLIAADSLFSVAAMAWLVVMFAYVDKATRLEEMAKRDVELMDEDEQEGE